MVLLAALVFASSQAPASPYRSSEPDPNHQALSTAEGRAEQLEKDLEDTLQELAVVKSREYFASQALEHVDLSLLKQQADGFMYIEARKSLEQIRERKKYLELRVLEIEKQKKLAIGNLQSTALEAIDRSYGVSLATLAQNAERRAIDRLDGVDMEFRVSEPNESTGFKPYKRERYVEVLSQLEDVGLSIALEIATGLKEKKTEEELASKREALLWNYLEAMYVARELAESDLHTGARNGNRRREFRKATFVMSIAAVLVGLFNLPGLVIASSASYSFLLGSEDLKLSEKAQRVLGWANPLAMFLIAPREYHETGWSLIRSHGAAAEVRKLLGSAYFSRKFRTVLREIGRARNPHEALFNATGLNREQAVISIQEPSRLAETARQMLLTDGTPQALVLSRPTEKAPSCEEVIKGLLKRLSEQGK